MLRDIELPNQGRYQLVFPEQTIPLYTMVFSCGYQRESSRSYFWEGTKRGENEFVIWQYTLGGKGALEYEGERYELWPGRAMLVHVPHEHTYFLPSDSREWRFIFVCMNGREILRICREIENDHGPVLDLDEASATVNTALNILHGADAGTLKTPYQASRVAYEMGMHLLQDTHSRRLRQQKKPSPIDKVIQYCMQHLDRPLGVEEMSRVCGYSRYHFSRLFSQYMGESPARFVTRLRLRKAVSLLQTALLSIDEVAEECGFSSTSYFCRVFKQYYGVPPGAFRGRG